MNEAEHVQMHVEHKNDAVIARPVGEIDLGGAASLRNQLREVQSSSPKRLIIDLREVPYMDSSGVATLVEVMQVARRTGAKLVLCGLQERVRAVFEIAKLDLVFTIAENADTSLSA